MSSEFSCLVVYVIRHSPQTNDGDTPSSRPLPEPSSAPDPNRSPETTHSDILVHITRHGRSDFNIERFCTNLRRSEEAKKSAIVSLRRYGERAGIPHRFLILHISPTDKKNFFLRLDRRGNRDQPLRFLSGFSTSDARDSVSIM